MTKRSYVQIDGVLYERGTEPNRSPPPSQGGPAILPDLPDFVSPIDGKGYSGRRGLREHCVRHDVVPNADLKGLPTLKTDSDQRRPEEVRRDKEMRKQLIIQQVNKHYR